MQTSRDLTPLSLAGVRVDGPGQDAYTRTLLSLPENYEMSHRAVLTTLLGAWLACTGSAAAATSWDALARDILADLIAANTAPSGGDDMRAAVSGLVPRLHDAGFHDDDVLVVGQTEKLSNLVVRYRSPNPVRRPVLLMAHLDVVEALPEDWTVEPFVMTEKDGYYYGRGATDNKAGAAMLVANFIRYKKEGFEPDRDLIVMLTADEESTGNGALWLTTDKRELIDAEFALNTDGGGVMTKDGKPRAFIMQTSEKVYVTYGLEAHDPGGHSSMPRPDNPITRLSRTLVALGDYDFPVDLNETTREFFAQWTSLAPPQERPLIEAVAGGTLDAEALRALRAKPYYNAIARTTCVATQLSGGHAENALPQSARAVVNCRVLPQSSGAATRAVIESMAKPHGVSVSAIYDARPSPPSPLAAHVVEPITAVANAMWPGIPVIPEMSTGASDGVFTRNAGIPTYGVSAIAENPDDIRAHDQDERIGVKAYRDAIEFWYRLVKAVSQPGAD